MPADRPVFPGAYLGALSSAGEGGGEVAGGLLSRLACEEDRCQRRRLIRIR